MGRMKEEFMQMRLEEQDQTYITMQEIAQETKDIMEKTPSNRTRKICG